MPRGLLAWTLKVVLVVGLGSVALAQYVAHSTDPRVQRLARGPAEPETTGAIGPAARASALDPCLARGR
ncbi:hypothetical protein [Methylobacterium sp. Leaf118]|uniref:hypothetical protein n=1 Tax=Methylobacterium sp. Leaf118 TaxID=2876562 RepID=UPI001E62547B|nr:hypothetical protein [Methylobacterium sp. Leaf118]